MPYVCVSGAFLVLYTGFVEISWQNLPYSVVLQKLFGSLGKAKSLTFGRFFFFSEFSARHSFNLHLEKKKCLSLWQKQDFSDIS